MDEEEEADLKITVAILQYLIKKLYRLYILYNNTWKILSNPKC